MKDEIKLTDIIRISDPEQYKLHLACTNADGERPLDVFVADFNEWIGWNEWKGSREDWTRDYIISLVEFYPQPDAWLFGGIFKVIERYSDRYRLEEVTEFKKYIGRLLLSFHRYQGMRGRAFYLENHLDELNVREIFASPYGGEAFPGSTGENTENPK